MIFLIKYQKKTFVIMLIVLEKTKVHDAVSCCKGKSCKPLHYSMSHQSRGKFSRQTLFMIKLLIITNDTNISYSYHRVVICHQ